MPCRCTNFIEDNWTQFLPTKLEIFLKKHGKSKRSKNYFHISCYFSAYGSILTVNCPLIEI